MTDNETEIEPEDEEEEHDPETCDDPYCEHGEDYEVTVERRVTFRLRAHSDEQAQAMAEDACQIDVRADPRAPVEDWDDGYDEVTVESESAQRAAAAERRRFMAEWEAKQATATEAEAKANT